MSADNDGSPAELESAGTYVPNRRVLYVDDEQALLSTFTSMMRKEQAETHVLQDSSQIENTLTAEGPFAVVLSDQRMPGLDGVGVLEAVSRIHPGTVRIMVTGYADHEDTLRAINVGGVSHYVAKPWKDDDFRALIAGSVSRFNLVQENRFLMDELAAKNIALSEVLDGTVSETVRMLGDLVEYVNPEAAARGLRIRQLGKAILEMMPEYGAEERWNAARAIDLCFLGVAVLPPWIQISLNKQGLGSLNRFPEAKDHHLLAAGLVKDIPRFGEVSRILRLQTKDFNGTGEPADEQVQGNDIPLGARLLHILIGLDRQISPNFNATEVLRRMKDQPAKYDTSIITRMLSGGKSPQGEEVEEVLGVEDLEAGMVPLEDIPSSSGQCLARAGVPLSATSREHTPANARKEPALRQRPG
jgi:response regulator RpfG family c-di-GMP phosphodiesterase